MAQFTHLLGSIYPLPEASWSKTPFSSHIKFQFCFCSSFFVLSLKVHQPVRLKVSQGARSLELLLCSSTRASEPECLNRICGDGARGEHSLFYMTVLNEKFYVQTKLQTVDAVLIAGGKLGPDFICLRRIAACDYRCHIRRKQLSILFAKAKEITGERLSRMCQSLKRVGFDKAGVQPDQIKFQEELSSLQLDLTIAYLRRVIHKGPIGWRKQHLQRRLTPGTCTKTSSFKAYVLTSLTSWAC